MSAVIRVMFIALVLRALMHVQQYNYKINMRHGNYERDINLQNHMSLR